MPSSIPYRVESFFHYYSDEDKPHRVYYLCHSDEGREGKELSSKASSKISSGV